MDDAKQRNIFFFLYCVHYFTWIFFFLNIIVAEQCWLKWEGKEGTFYSESISERNENQLWQLKKSLFLNHHSFANVGMDKKCCCLLLPISFIMASFFLTVFVEGIDSVSFTLTPPCRAAPSPTTSASVSPLPLHFPPPPWTTKWRGRWTFCWKKKAPQIWSQLTWIKNLPNQG